MFRLFKYEIMWICGAIQFIRLGVVVGFNFWLPSLLVADRGLSIQEAGLVVAMGAAFTVLSNVLGGYVSDRLRNPPLVIGGSLAVVACTSTLLVLVHSIPLLLVVVAINSIFLQFYFGALFFVPVEVLGQRIAGMSTGFSNLFANIGALTFAYSLGVVKDRAGTLHLGLCRHQRRMRCRRHAGFCPGAHEETGRSQGRTGSSGARAVSERVAPACAGKLRDWATFRRSSRLATSLAKPTWCADLAGVHFNAIFARHQPCPEVTTLQLQVSEDSLPQRVMPGKQTGRFADAVLCREQITIP